jgi:hypothetical protein
VATQGPRLDVAESVVASWRVQLRAMDEADVDTLRACFAPGVTLTHMTGFEQPLEEWLDGIRERQFIYHRVIERSVSVTATSETGAHLTGHIITGVTDDGSGQAWRMRVEQDYERVEDAWFCSSARVTLG